MQIVCPEPLGPDLFRRLFDHRPPRPVAQALSNLPHLPIERPVFDAGSGMAGVDAVLEPHLDGDGPVVSSLSLAVNQYPASIPLTTR